MINSIKLTLLLILTSSTYSMDPETIYNDGKKLLSKNQILQAEELFNKSLGIDPSFAPAIKGLSELYLHKGDLKKANEYAIQAVQADEDFRDWSVKISKI